MGSACSRETWSSGWNERNPQGPGPRRRGLPSPSSLPQAWPSRAGCSPPGGHVSRPEEAWSRGTPSLPWGPPTRAPASVGARLPEGPTDCQVSQKKNPVSALPLPLHAVSLPRPPVARQARGTCSNSPGWAGRMVGCSGARGLGTVRMGTQGRQRPAQGSRVGSYGGHRTWGRARTRPAPRGNQHTRSQEAPSAPSPC